MIIQLDSSVIRFYSTYWTTLEASKDKIALGKDTLISMIQKAPGRETNGAH